MRVPELRAVLADAIHTARRNDDLVHLQLEHGEALQTMLADRAVRGRELREAARDVGASVREATRLLRDLEAALLVCQESAIAMAATVEVATKEEIL